ncbi:MAG TPA: GNAT family N-acetyltransferase [Verrucomicrobiae bacterium]|nr:GNAT family N-acetyltransferase [Verrucomicrobiae bacterium]
MNPSLEYEHLPPENILIRPVTEADEAFLRHLYQVTRYDEFAAAGLDDRHLSQLLAIQFRAHQTGHRSMFPTADFSLILRDSAPVGRLTVHRGADEWRVVDIALLPAHRGKGIGGKVLAGVQREARQAGKVLRLNVRHDNPAARLYARLGFQRTGANEIDVSMEWQP